MEDISFDSADYADTEQAFAEYVRLYSVGADVRRRSGPFRAVVRAWRLDGVLLFDRHLAGVEHTREDRAGRDGFDHIVATLVVSGSVVSSSAHHASTQCSGDIAFFDTRRAHRNSVEQAHVITAAISRDLVEAAVGNAAGLNATVVSPPDTLLLADFMTSLVRHAPHVPELRNAGYARALAELLSVTLLGQRDLGADVRRRDFLRRQAAEHAMDAALGDASLTSADLAERTGLSRSTLYRLFEKQGGVAHALTMRRVDAVRQQLEHSAPSDPDALAAEFGFTDRTQMERNFERIVGRTTEAYRAAVVESRTDSGDTGQRRWRGWFTELA